MSGQFVILRPMNSCVQGETPRKNRGPGPLSDDGARQAAGRKTKAAPAAPTLGAFDTRDCDSSGYHRDCNRRAAVRCVKRVELKCLRFGEYETVAELCKNLDRLRSRGTVMSALWTPLVGRSPWFADFAHVHACRFVRSGGVPPNKCPSLLRSHTGGQPGGARRPAPTCHIR